ncbi:MAG: hypothetical protein ACSHX0_07955 [Akkermansiaceae bacterium]
MFFGSLAAGNNKAVLYTLIEYCKSSGLNPREYLEYDLENYADMTAEQLTPYRIAQEWNTDIKFAYSILKILIVNR